MKPDGSLGPRQAVATTKVDKPAEGSVYFSFWPQIATGPGSDTGTIGIWSNQETWAPGSSGWSENYAYTLGELKADGSLASSQQIATSTYGLNWPDLAVSADGTGAAEWRINSGSPSWDETLMTSKLTRDTTLCGVNPAVCAPVLNVASITPKKGKIKAGKAITIKVTVTNTGNKDATGVTATVKSGNKRVKVPTKISFGSIAIGGTVTKTVKVKAKGKAKGKAKITVKAGSSSRSATYKVKAAKKKKKARKKGKRK